MRLSEAILLGRHLMPKISGGHSSTCAIGMAHRAMGNAALADKGTEEPYVELTRIWPFLWTYVACPWCPKKKLLYGSEVVFHPFDNHLMGDKTMTTLEQLCDWIRTIEPADEPATAPEVAEREIVSVEP